MKNSNKIFWIFISIIILFIGFWSFYRTYELKSNHVLLTGRIIEIASTNKSSPVFLCEIFYEGNRKIISSTTSISKMNLFIGKYFPFIYSNKINGGKILITPEDFNQYGILFPDSLKWVLPYIK
jgi:hypothetical protein